LQFSLATMIGYNSDGRNPQEAVLSVLEWMKKK
jgi:hypothetical protein